MHGRASLGGSDHLDFELPFTSKLLLLAAYVCSRNRPALDRRLFDPSSRAGRRRSTMASDKQVRDLALNASPQSGCSPTPVLRHDACALGAALPQLHAAWASYA